MTMTRRTRPIRLSSLIILLLQSSSFALRNFVVQFNQIKCIENKNYVESIHCIINKNLKSSSLDVEFKMKKEVQQMFIDINVYLVSPKREPARVFTVNRADYCALNKKESTDLIASLFRNILNRAGNPPDACPIAADYHYKFRNMTVDTEYLPAIIPKVIIKTVVVYYDGRTSFLNLTCLTRAVYKKSNNKGH